MKEQADIAPKAGYHRHDDTLPLVVAVRSQRSDICWTSIVLLLESVCPKPCWNRVRQTVKETIGVGVNEKAALSSDKNCPFVYINFDFTLVNKVASL